MYDGSQFLTHTYRVDSSWYSNIDTEFYIAAGGRYDELIKSQMPGHQHRSVHGPRAVGFGFNWERLCTSMARYQKAHIKAKTKRRIDHETPSFSMPRRCEVLVDSSDRGLLHSTGIDIIQGLWYDCP